MAVLCHLRKLIPGMKRLLDFCFNVPPPGVSIGRPLLLVCFVWSQWLTVTCGRVLTSRRIPKFRNVNYGCTTTSTMVAQQRQLWLHNNVNYGCTTTSTMVAQQRRHRGQLKLKLSIATSAINRVTKSIKFIPRPSNNLY